jgi:hypothetical protein
MNDLWAIIMVLVFFSSALKAYSIIVSPRPFELLFAAWLPFFLIYAAATARIPGLHSLMSALGLVAGVTEHEEGWKALLAFSFGVIGGGWVGAKARQLRSNDARK